jgi:predicted RNA-binding Zn ribbon-like protein
MPQDERELVWDFDAGRLPLDFANTAEWHAAQKPIEKLNSYTDLVDWSEAAGLLTGAEGKQLLRSARSRPREAEAVFRQARELREDIYSILSSIAGGKPLPEEPMRRYNEALTRAFRTASIKSTRDGFAWSWAGAIQGLDVMLGPILKATAELLTSEDLPQIGECADDRGCGYLFLDTSRNHNRRWCSMESCGNRAKARRYYARKKTNA